MLLIEFGLNSRPCALTKPATFSSALIRRSDMRSPVFGLARRNRFASATASGFTSAWAFLPSHLPLADVVQHASERLRDVWLGQEACAARHLIFTRCTSSRTHNDDGRRPAFSHVVR